MPHPVSHMHAAAAVGAGSVSEMTQVYKYYKYEITFGRTFGFVNRRIADAHESDFELLGV